MDGLLDAGLLSPVRAGTPRLGKAAAKQLLAEATQTNRSLREVLADHLTPDEIASLCDPTTYTGGAGSLVDRALRTSDTATPSAASTAPPANA